MKFSFRTKLGLSYLLILIVTCVFLFAFLSPRLGKVVEGKIRENLIVQANVAARVAALEISDLRVDAQAFADSLSRITSARVTIIHGDGTVLADSEVIRTELESLDNHGNRPEIKDAFRTGQGTAVRYSATLQTDMVYAAVQFRDKLQERGVVRLALPLTAVGIVRSIVNTTIAESLFFAFTLAFLLSLFVFRLNMRPLQRIAAVVKEIGHGNFSRRLPVETGDELSGMSKSINEMAERIEVQMEKLSTETGQLQAILSGIGEGLMVGDAQGTITMVNAAFCELFDVTENIVGSSLINISRHPSLHDSFKKVIINKCEHQEEVVITSNRERVVRVNWVPLLLDGRLQGIVAVFHDISDLKRLENIRKDFVANVSHELRTPVTVIKGYAETLLGGTITESPENTLRFVEVIYSHAERLANLLRDLLSLSEMESDAFALQLQPMHLGGVIRQVCQLLEDRATAKSITISCEGIVDAPLVLADAGRLEQVFVNLVDNAIKYSPVGSNVVIRVEDQGGSLKVAVADNGPGIPPNNLPRIFERFYRVDGGRSRTEGGTGLGLSIVKHIIKLHGGSITCESTMGEGTSFFFTLQKASTER